MTPEPRPPGAPLVPSESLLQRLESAVYLQRLRLEVGDAKEWMLEVPSSPETAEPTAIRVNVGLLLEDELTQKTANKATHQIAQQLAEHPNTGAVENLLRWSPYWLEALDHTRMEKIGPHETDNVLLRYRLCEICLRALRIFDRNSTLLKNTQWLLLRQRFRFLAPLTLDPTVLEILPHRDRLVREARQAYGEGLVNNADEIALALSDAAQPPRWDLDAEIKLLLLDEDGRRWPFAYQLPGDRHYSERLVHRGLLARENVWAASEVVAKTLIPEGKFGRPRSILIFFLHRLHLVFFILTLLAAVMVFSVAFGYPIVSHGWAWVSVALALGFPLLIWLLPALLQGFRGYSLYPIALRVPAMSVVGILAIVGLADPVISFGFNALQEPLAVLLLVGASGLGSLAYIFFEVQARVNDTCPAIGRALLLWSYSLASTFWLAFFTALIADPLRLTACDPKEIGDACMNGMLVLNHMFSLGKYRISADFILVVTALALVIGVFTQIFWEDKAIAEPL